MFFLSYSFLSDFFSIVISKASIQFYTNMDFSSGQEYQIKANFSSSVVFHLSLCCIV